VPHLRRAKLNRHQLIRSSSMASKKAGGGVGPQDPVRHRVHDARFTKLAEQAKAAVAAKAAA